MSRATLSGEVRGTPGFMAPEQLDRKMLCDERTDVYGLGALLYDMLMGKTPDKDRDFDELKIPSEIKLVKTPAGRFLFT